MSFSDNLKQIRKEKGLSQEDYSGSHSRDRLHVEYTMWGSVD